MSKEYRLNIRITPLFKKDLQEMADYHGLTVSSYVHSILIKQIRREQAELKGEFPRQTTLPDGTISTQLGGPVAFNQEVPSLKEEAK